MRPEHVFAFKEAALQPHTAQGAPLVLTCNEHHGDVWGPFSQHISACGALGRVVIPQDILSLLVMNFGRYLWC